LRYSQVRGGRNLLRELQVGQQKSSLGTCYRHMLRICRSDHRTSEYVLNEIGADRELVATVRKWKPHYFAHTIRAQNLCTRVFEGQLNGTRSRGMPRR